MQRKHIQTTATVVGLYSRALHVKVRTDGNINGNKYIYMNRFERCRELPFVDVRQLGRTVRTAIRVVLVFDEHQRKFVCIRCSVWMVIL